MLCEKCKKKEATYHSTVNINGHITATHLCSDCAISENKMSNLFNVGNFFATPLMDFWEEDSGEKQPTGKTARCPKCHKTFDDFLQTGLLGCAHCYQTFKSELAPVIKNMQPDTVHKGKNLQPVEFSEGENVIKNLEFKLKQAVAAENYELASELKKKINELKNGGQNNE